MHVKRQLYKKLYPSAPCELPLLHGATYEAGYRAGLTVAHASSVNIACEPGRSPPATLNCHLGRLQPTVHDFCRPLGKKCVCLYIIVKIVESSFYLVYRKYLFWSTCQMSKFNSVQNSKMIVRSSRNLNSWVGHLGRQEERRDTGVLLEW